MGNKWNRQKKRWIHCDNNGLMIFCMKRWNMSYMVKWYQAKNKKWCLEKLESEFVQSTTHLNTLWKKNCNKVTFLCMQIFAFYVRRCKKVLFSMQTIAFVDRQNSWCQRTNGGVVLCMWNDYPSCLFVSTLTDPNSQSIHNSTVSSVQKHYIFSSAVTITETLYTYIRCDQWSRL